MMEDYNKVSGMLSDQDIRHYWKKGIYVYDTEKKFDLEKQLQLGAIDLRFRNEYKKIELMGENQMLTYDMIKNHSYTKPYELKADEKLVIKPGEINFNNHDGDCTAYRTVCSTYFWQKQFCPFGYHGSLLPRIYQAWSWTNDTVADY